MACRTGCPTKDHRTWGECARAAELKVAYCGIGGVSASEQRKWDNDLAAYKDARRQGIQPSSTRREAVDRAVKISDKTGQAWQAG